MPDRTGPHLGWEAADRAVAEAIADRHSILGKRVLVGLSGAQGSGKSTMAPRIAALLTARGLQATVLALDDFYLPRAARAVLAREVHPLLATRGVPGTHDVALLGSAIDDLLAGRSTTVPRFDKASDDRTGEVRVEGPVDAVILEGWCIGAGAQSAEALAEPVNALEREEDPDATWRQWVNDHLAGDYKDLFERLDLRVFLRAPDFTVVAKWRGEQEAHLGVRGMSPAAIKRFIAHFERITRAMLSDEPADIVIDLDAARTPTGIREKSAGAPRSTW